MISLSSMKPSTSRQVNPAAFSWSILPTVVLVINDIVVFNETFDFKVSKLCCVLVVNTSDRRVGYQCFHYGLG